jgi:hypothetical protein
MRLCLVIVLAWIAPALAEAPHPVAEASTFGAVAAQAPLCGLRDEHWAEDLRLAARELPADPRQIVAALGYGDMEALEDFAADSPRVVCPALAANPALARADAAVARYREARKGKPVG